MSEQTVIAWTDHTFNPWMGCTKVSAGCAHCYAETLTKNRMGLSLWGPGSARQVTAPGNWAKVKTWDRAAKSLGESQRCFCASLCDVFEDHPTANATRPRLWDWIRAHKNLDWQILTKRPERIADNLPEDWGDGWDHVWLGTSIEDNRVADRANYLRDVPAVVRFISYEPAIGPLDRLNMEGLHWVIYGGESGSGYRPEDKDWARNMREKCLESGAAFFHKQSSGYKTELGIELDGEIVRAYPRERRQLMERSLLV